MLHAFIRYKRANYTNIRYTKRSTIRLHVIRETQYTTIHWSLLLSILIRIKEFVHFRTVRLFEKF